MLSDFHRVLIVPRDGYNFYCRCIPLTILCIDDEELGQEVRRIVLERAGYDVLMASDGQSGLSLFDSHRVDAVVLDYSMPGLDGGQVAAIMRARNPSIPILMLSAYVELPKEVMRLVDAFATKGNGPLTLIGQLEKLLKDRGRISPQAAAH